MKKQFSVKKISLVVFLVATILQLSSSKIFAVEAPPERQPDLLICYSNETDEFSSFGNYCITGNGQCLKNLCPTGTHDHERN